ncbi:hypothetical protein H2O64_22065 [Kordia sp. YSTF-M3]|uniref:Uncharacterized protein n=1 Tax=Kordia aestuariivivens TaxID=2759037 RepID=A0ABR7QG74_9FLAO|nr:hypothetical protein [Kordia aestuariivivens]MBC8757371.1 hypothetical protein [Kordia aestuariivivens]
MSRFNYIYAPLATIKLQHTNGLETEKHVKIYPSKETAALIAKYKLVIKMIPEGLVVIYKKQEAFVAETVDEVLIIDGEEVIDKRIVGYVSTSPDRTFSNWLPDVVDFDLEFYAIADQEYRNATNWNDLALKDFVVYSATDLEGTITINNNINERIQPDAILQLNIKEANIETPTTLTFENNII